MSEFDYNKWASITISHETWDHNYRAPGEKTPVDSWWRNAKACAAIEKEEIREQVEKDFYWLLSDFKGNPGGRINANIGVEGRDATTLLNCFFHASDLSHMRNPADSLAGIFELLDAQSQTLKSEGGYGTNFSYIRPSGSYVTGIGGRTPGVLKFMELWDKSSEIITMGSEKSIGGRKKGEKKKIRKGAQMSVLDVFHPEILEYIDSKLVQGRFTKFNISVGIIDGFMEAIINDADWDLRFPDTSFEKYDDEWDGVIEKWESKGYPVVIYQTVKARDLWEKIMKATYVRNDPGVLFSGLANKLNPISYAEHIRGTNPCFTGDMRFLTEKGYKTFKSSVDNGDSEKIYSDDRISFVNGKHVIDINKQRTVTLRDTSCAFVTQEDAEVIELEFDNGQKIKCTPNHKFATTQGMIEAENLTPKHHILISLPKAPNGFKSNAETLQLFSPFVDDLIVPDVVLENARTHVGFDYLNKFPHHNNGEVKSTSRKHLEQLQLVYFANGLYTKISKIENSVYYKLTVIRDENIYAHIASITKLENETVYCLTEPVTHSLIVSGVSVSNCGEILLPSPGVCLLFSLNLTKFITKNQITNKFEFDFETFRKSISIATRFADNINDITRTPLPEYKQSLIDKRRIGIGVVGLGSLFYMLGIRYGSKESIDLVDNISKIKCEEELLASAKLGKEKGSFPLFDREKFFTSHFWKTLPISPEVKKEVEEIGEMRNSHRSANAPTGNMSITVGCVSGSIEPVFLKEYIRWITVVDSERASLKEQGFTFPNPLIGEWFETEHLRLSKAGDDDILLGEFNGSKYQVDKSRGLTKAELIMDYGWRFVKENYTSEEIAKMESDGIFATTEQLTVNEHLDVLKIIAKYIDQNSSKTVNLPNDYPYEDFKNLYIDAWKSGIKGITTYRAGTMTAVLQSVDSSNKEEVIDYKTVNVSKDRPKKLQSETHKVKLEAGDEVKNAYVTVSFNGKDPYEVFINTPVGDNLKDMQILELTSRLSSLAMRYGVPVDEIINQLRKVDGQFIYSIPNTLSKVLNEYVKTESDGINHMVCPSCGEKTYIKKDGCTLCLSCSYSACG